MDSGANARFHRELRSYYNPYQLNRVIWPFALSKIGAPRKDGREDNSMRRLFSLAAFGFGFYYLWNNNDPTVEFVAVGAMGLALVLEFIGAD